MKKYKAVLNEDAVGETKDTPYCVEIYLTDENGDYVESVDFECYETLQEANERIDEINTKGTL